MSRATARALAGIALLGATTAPLHANRESDALRARASHDIYNLDRDQAIAGFRQAIAADPQDAAAYRGLASALWISITFRRGNMTVDDYLGRPVSQSTKGPPPPADIAAAFHDAVDRATAIARDRIARNAKDADAHYQLGAAVGLRASYAATVEGSAMNAFKAARQAYDEHEQVLELDPRRKDAGLIVGTYRYLVSALAMPLRWMAYVVGFGGGKERGLKMIEEAAAFGGDNQEDARFALVLLYNREKRYDDALRMLATLRERYPRNRLAWLEAGATALRAGRPADAERFLSDGLARTASDTRQRMFGEDALWYYKRGAARAALGRVGDADTDLRRALSAEGRKWVHGRTHFELGKLAMKAGKAAVAREEFRAAISLCESDNDAATAATARQLMNTAK
ncbi:MAG TPA: tetratricopeptide repeat protein [Vicinamibacterales bacterium]|jgi:tetratricopeptide (TPR) repeat protein|nr:tetratricopeptide repeat protein [Vicinamibacterales bacterium]